MQPVFIKGKIFCNGKAHNICFSCYKLQNAGKIFHCHSSSAASVPHQLSVCKVGGMEKPRIQHINVQMNQDMIKTLCKF